MVSLQIYVDIRLYKYCYNPASIIYKSTAGRYRPVSYPDGPITARYRFMSNAYWEQIEIANIVILM